MSATIVLSEDCKFKTEFVVEQDSTIAEAISYETGIPASAMSIENLDDAVLVKIKPESNFAAMLARFHAAKNADLLPHANLQTLYRNLFSTLPWYTGTLDVLLPKGWEKVDHDTMKDDFDKAIQCVWTTAVLRGDYVLAADLWEEQGNDVITTKLLTTTLRRLCNSPKQLPALIHNYPEAVAISRRLPSHAIQHVRDFFDEVYEFASQHMDATQLIVYNRALRRAFAHNNKLLKILAEWM